MTDTPKKYSDGPTIIPGKKPGDVDTFIAPPLPTIDRAPQVGDLVNYWPGATPPAADAIAAPATISKVYTTRLVDLEFANIIDDEATGNPATRLVPFLHDGDPDPHSPMGRCRHARERQVIGAGDVGNLRDVLP